MSKSIIMYGIAFLFVACLTQNTFADFMILPINGFIRQSYTGSRNVLVPRFDTSLGTLQSIKLDTNPEISGTIEGTALGPANSPNGWAAGLGGNLLLAGPGVSATAAASFGDRSGLLFQPGLKVFEVYGPEVRPISVSLSSSLASYQGIGNTSLTLSWPSYTPQLFFSNGGRLDQAARDMGMQTGTVTYTFTAVPEPASLKTVGFAFAALITFASLRSKKRLLFASGSDLSRRSGL